MVLFPVPTAGHSACKPVTEGVCYRVRYNSCLSRENGLSDSITLIKGRVEDVELPVDKVDEAPLLVYVREEDFYY